ncbi:reverse ribonuclease integrase [Lasius niger]|uniref:Reverse ribonuclease integrase n=1 Tax=Lasius niger TaxID=67767 RepID=A0A0J7K2X3_LASNI|nr:reverse ribonuclease integrase [Lasius niger]
MLLEMQAEGAHPFPLQEASEEILLTMRPRRSAHQRLPPAGKRRTGRGRRGRDQHPDIRLKYTPRPHLDVHIHHHEYSALLDTGFEISFINEITADELRREGYHVVPHGGQIQMANGATADIPGIVRLPIQIQRQIYQHDFSILPALKSAVLIGIDQWARTGIAIPPPRRPPANQAAPRCNTTGGLAPCTRREQQRLQEFLKTELEKVTGKVAQTPPAKTMHAINIDRPWEQVTIDLVGPKVKDRKHMAPSDARPVYQMGRTCAATTSNRTERHQGPQFATRLKECGIKHRTAPVYSPHCNPVERTNRTVKTMISQFVDKNHRDWDENLPALQIAYNTATHDATGFSLAYLNYGREPCPPHPGDGTRAGDADPAALPQKLNDAYALVRVKLARAF